MLHRAANGNSISLLEVQQVSAVIRGASSNNLWSVGHVHNIEILGWFRLGAFFHCILRASVGAHLIFFSHLNASRNLSENKLISPGRRVFWNVEFGGMKEEGD